MKHNEIPPGSLTLLILRTLSRHGTLHGYEIAESILQTSGNVLEVEEGSLYPALQKMLVNDWVKAEWGVTKGNRRARYYQLTAAGRKQLAAESSNFERVYSAIARVLQTA